MTWVWIIVAIVLVVMWVYIAGFMSEVATEKGYPDINAFAKVFQLGICGCLYIIALPDRVERKNQEEIMRLLKGDTELETKKPSRKMISTSASASYGASKMDELPDL